MPGIAVKVGAALVCVFAAIVGVIFLLKGRNATSDKDGPGVQDHPSTGPSAGSPHKSRVTYPPNLHPIDRNNYPNPATAKDWDQVRVLGDAIKYEGLKIKCGFAFNLWPVLEAKKNAWVNPASILNQRGPANDISTSLWSPSVAFTKLTVHWDKKCVIDEDPDVAKLGLQTRTDDKLPILQPHIGFLNAQQISVSYRTKDEKTVHIPYPNEGFKIMCSYALPDYPIAACTKNKNQPWELLSIIILDIANGKLVGEIHVPNEIRNTSAGFVLDRQNDIFVAVDTQLNWMAVIDVKDLVFQIKDQEQKPRGP